MGTYPTTPRAAFLAWCQAHKDVFTTNAAAIGITPAMATIFKTATETAAADALAQEKARLAALAATQTTNNSFQALRRAALDTVRTIRTFAENTGNPAVYQIAQIPPPAIPTPAAPPGQPTELTCTLDASSGDLELRWKANNPAGTSGTSYIVRRRVPSEGGGSFTFVGATGAKRFVDSTFVSGPDSVQYTVQGQRADSAGPVSQIFTVNFGRMPGGGIVASVTGESGPTALAA